MYDKSILKHMVGSITNGGNCGSARENPCDSNNSDQFTEKHNLQENLTRMGLVLSRKKLGGKNKFKKKIKKEGKAILWGISFQVLQKEVMDTKKMLS